MSNISVYMSFANWETSMVRAVTAVLASLKRLSKGPYSLLKLRKQLFTDSHRTCGGSILSQQRVVTS